MARMAEERYFHAICFRAYLIWEDRVARREEGDALTDWLEAKRQLRISDEAVLELARRLLNARGLSIYPCTPDCLIWHEALGDLFNDLPYEHRRQAAA